MILVAGLSPAWQRILQFPSLRIGEVNRAAAAYACASGKPVNVAIALAHLGADHQLTTVLGGPEGKAIRRELVSLNVCDASIEVEAPTRVCTTLLCADGTMTELVEESRALSPDEIDGFTSTALEFAEKADVVVMTGSIPAGVSSDLWSILLGDCRGKAILDVRGPALVAALARRPFLVKPNREELEQTVGRKLPTAGEVLAAMQELNDRGAEWVVVTAGADAVFASGPGGRFRAVPPRIEVVNAIGSGDCFAATLAWRAAMGETPPESLRWAIAAASHNAEALLPARLDLKRVAELAERVEVRQID